MFYKLFDIVSIGIPFGVFKVTSGLYYKIDFILWWGVVDLLLNSINFLIYLFMKKKVLPSCSLSLIGSIVGKQLQRSDEVTEDIGESLDVLFSFCIVAIVIGTGAISNYSESMLRYWNISVILNVLGAGSIRVFQSVRKFKNS